MKAKHSALVIIVLQGGDGGRLAFVRPFLFSKILSLTKFPYTGKFSKRNLHDFTNIFI